MKVKLPVADLFEQRHHHARQRRENCVVKTDEVRVVNCLQKHAHIHNSNKIVLTPSDVFQRLYTFSQTQHITGICSHMNWGRGGIFPTRVAPSVAHNAVSILQW